MEITVENVSGPVPVAVICTHGDIDASNFMQLVAKTQEVYASGVRDVLLDLGDTPFLSSSGLVALHSMALLMRGEQALDPEAGWAAIHDMDFELNAGMQKHIKLLNPQPRVAKTLERTGLTSYLEIYTDRDAALASYRKEAGAQAPAA